MVSKKDEDQLLLPSIESIVDYEDELIIVDNGSESTTQKWIKENADKSLIFPENQGFSKGFNEGVKIARGDYVMMANNDTEFPHDWDIKLVDTIEKNPTKENALWPGPWHIGRRADFS